ncbi:MAG: glycosyltransferase [Acidobacteriaceae bacterium]
MKVLVNVVFWVAVVGSVTSSIYCAMVVVAAVRFGLRRRREQREVADFLPAVSMLKPLHGTEAGLERNLESFFEQEYPGEWELLFCARQETDEGLKLARVVGDRYPGVSARYVTCGEPTPKFHNAKVYSLAAMDAVAAHAMYVTSDADVRVEKDYLLRVVQTLKDPHCGLASCLYLGTAHAGGGFASQLDAVGKSVEMSSGVLVADMLEGTKFALGATMVLPKKSFQDVGGFDELGQFYADDFVIGNRLATQGKGVRMATYVIRLMVQDSPFWLSFRNQLRWMQSTRRSRPWGHLGSGLTFSMPFGLLGLVWGLLSGHAALGIAWLVVMVLNRWLQAGAILGVMGDPESFYNAAIYPLRDLLGWVLWVGSYGGENFYYRGKIYKLKDGGRVEE